MAVLSTSVGEAGCFEHISIWRLSNLTEVACFSQQISTEHADFKVGSDLDYPDFGAPWHQISFCSDVLLLACRKGLAVLDLTNLDAWLSALSVKPLREAGEGWHNIAEFVKSHIRFHGDKKGATLSVSEAGL